MFEQTDARSGSQDQASQSFLYALFWGKWAGSFGAVLMVSIFVAVLLGPLTFIKLEHALTRSPDRSSLLVGTWVGSASLDPDSTDEMSRGNAIGSWPVFLEVHRDYLTDLDEVSGTVRVCTDHGVSAAASFKHDLLRHGAASLTIAHDFSGRSPLSVDAAKLATNDGTLAFKGTVSGLDLIGTLYRGDPGSFDHACDDAASAVRRLERKQL